MKTEKNRTWEDNSGRLFSEDREIFLPILFSVVQPLAGNTGERHVEEFRFQECEAPAVSGFGRSPVTQELFEFQGERSQMISFL